VPAKRAVNYAIPRRTAITSAGRGVSGGKYRTVFTESAREEIRKLPRTVAMAILRKLTELENDPYAYGTTGLVSAPEVRRLRVGDHRVFYTVDNGILLITVVQVAARSVAYD